MITRLLYTFPRRELTPYERLINLPEIMASILIISIASSLLALLGRLAVGVNGIWIPPITFGAIALISSGLFFLNRRGYYTQASLSLFLTISLGATYNIAIFNGIYDVGIFVYPVLIVIGSMLFGRRWVMPITFFTLAMLTIVHLVSILGYYQPFGFYQSRSQDFYTNLVLLFVAGLFTLMVMSILDENITHVLESENKLQDTYEKALNGWSKALELRDRETEGHTRRVADLTTQLAKHFNFSEDEIKFIEWGALLHDIGKMGVPDEILRKPDKLTPEEMEKVQKHPDFAMELLGNIPYLQPALTIPQYHHERYNGSGYPKGLKGDQIPLEARIFAVADVYDALVSDRPYSKAWTPAEAKKYLKDQSGKEFDPDIIQIFLNKVLK